MLWWAIWWLAYLTAIGLCLGSFLNVVIYRLPLERPLTGWSHCPCCGQGIRWYDNIPVLSFILLAGRCRFCGERISPRYPLVEMATAVAVLVLFDAFFVGQTRQGLINQTAISWGLSEDWPIFLAHVVLFVCLLGMAAIDLQEYWVDIRFTAVATVCGFVLHSLWTPLHSRPRPPLEQGWLRPDDATAVWCLGALIGLLLVWLLRLAWLGWGGAVEGSESEPDPAASTDPTAAQPLNLSTAADSSAEETPQQTTTKSVVPGEAEDQPAGLEPVEDNDTGRPVKLHLLFGYLGRCWWRGC